MDTTLISWVENYVVALDAPAVTPPPNLAIRLLLPKELDPGDAARFQLTYSWRVVGTKLHAAGDPSVKLIVCEKSTPNSTGEGSPLNGAGETLARGDGTATIMFDGTGTLLAPNGLPLQLVLANSAVGCGAIVIFSAWVRWFTT